MKIKEVEYGETISHNYNNYRVVLRAEIDENEDVDTVINELRKEVRDKIAESIVYAEMNIDDRIKFYRDMLNNIEYMIRDLKSSKEYFSIEDIANAIDIVERKKKEIERKIKEIKGDDENGN